MDVEQETRPAHDADVVAFLAEVEGRQKALWAILCHGRIGISIGSDPQWGAWATVVVYLPAYVGDLDVRAWMHEWGEPAKACLNSATYAVLGERYGEPNYDIQWLIPVPDQLADFVARTSQRPLPSRFQSTAVEFTERDGITWLTPPEAKLYDRLKAGGWVFVPQPAVVFGDESWLGPDFLIFWGGKASQAVMVEVDSDTFHAKPSIRERDEVKERRFESLGFGYLRFSAKACLHEPLEVVAEIQKFCLERFGPSRPVDQRLRIPTESGHPFRSNPGTCSDESGHPGRRPSRSPGVR